MSISDKMAESGDESIDEIASLSIRSDTRDDHPLLASQEAEANTGGPQTRLGYELWQDDRPPGRTSYIAKICQAPFLRYNAKTLSLFKS